MCLSKRSISERKYLRLCQSECLHNDDLLAASPNFQAIRRSIYYSLRTYAHIRGGDTSNFGFESRFVRGWRMPCAGGLRKQRTKIFMSSNSHSPHRLLNEQDTECGRNQSQHHQHVRSQALSKWRLASKGPSQQGDPDGSRNRDRKRLVVGLGDQIAIVQIQHRQLRADRDEVRRQHFPRTHGRIRAHGRVSRSGG